MAGSFGYELDLNTISEEEKQCVKKQIQKYHKYWNLIHNGEYYRLTNPFERADLAAWAFVSEDQTEALLNVVTLETHGNPLTSYVRLRGLDPEMLYQGEESGCMYSGAALMNVGIPVPCRMGEYLAWQIHLTAVF